MFVAIFYDEDHGFRGLRICHTLEDGITTCQSQCTIWDLFNPDDKMQNPARADWEKHNPMPSNTPYMSEAWKEWQKGRPTWYIANPDPHPYTVYNVYNNSQLYETDENGSIDLEHNLFEFFDLSLRVEH